MTDEEKKIVNDRIRSYPAGILRTHWYDDQGDLEDTDYEGLEDEDHQWEHG